MPSTLGRARTAPSTAGRSVERVLIIVLALALGAAWLWVARDAPRVAMTIQNPGSCALWVTVAHADGSGNVNVGTVAAGRDRAEPQLLDRGSVFRFRFALAGTVVATDSVDRADLEARDWHYTIPERPELSPPGCQPA